MLAPPVLTRWQIKPRDLNTERLIAERAGVSGLVAAILAQRGITDPDDVKAFLYPRLDALHDPEILPDYRAAVDEILAARDQKQKIYVHGDYDADGVTSASLFTRFLRSIGCEVIVHVPHRITEGYGIHLMAVEAAAEAGAKLFLTCDCGVAAFDQVELAKERGMRVVVTDHHEPTQGIPAAHAVVNPHREDSTYPFDMLSGVGVVLKLCAGITKELGHPTERFYRAFLDLATIGTVADVMPLIGENRIIVKHGLEQLRVTKKPGLKALLALATKPGVPLTARDIGFGIGPRLNAAGRIDDASLALDILLEQDEAKAQEMALHLEELNIHRKSEQTRITDEAAEIVMAGSDYTETIIVVAKAGWHPGLVGLAASKLTERFYRPTFVLTIDEETGLAKGSARTIPGFHLADAIHANRHLITSGGGHQMAAGVSMLAENIDAFRAAMLAHAEQVMLPEHFTRQIPIDVEVEPDEVTYEAVEELNLLQPFGTANEEPIFSARDLLIESARPTRTSEHVMFELRTPGGKLIRGPGFGLGPRIRELRAGIKIHAIFQPKIETYQGDTSLKWHIRDFVAAER